MNRPHIIDALEAEWAAIDALAASLTPEQWDLPSPLLGWDVRANVVHVFGVELMLLGQSPAVTVDADAFDHVRNPIGAANEAWIASFAETPIEELMIEFRRATSERLAVLRAMSDEEWNAVGFTPAGEGPYGRFMQIRVFDCWMHEQDVRAAIGMPGHESGLPVEVSLDEMTTAMGFVVGKRAGALDGSSVTFDLIGDAARRIHVRVDGRAAVVPDLDGPATVTLTMPVLSFSRIAGGRQDAPNHAERCEITGDIELGERVLANLAYTI